MTRLEMTAELGATTSVATRPGGQTRTSAATVSPEHSELGPQPPASLFLPLLTTQSQAKKTEYAPQTKHIGRPTSSDTGPDGTKEVQSLIFCCCC